VASESAGAEAAGESSAEQTAELTGAEAAAEPSGVQPATAAEPVAGRRAILLVSAAAVVVLAVIGVAVYLLVRDDSSGETAAGQVPTIQDSGEPGTSTSTTTPSPSSSTPPMTVPSSTGASTEVAGSGGDVGDAQDVAEQAVSAISSADVSTLAQLSCDPTTAGDEDSFPAGAKAEVVGEPKISGDTATIDVKLTFEGAEPAVVPMPLTKQNGRWCIL
jgi:hypothetical protein